MKNPRYQINKKNGGLVPPLLDPRAKLIPVSCGKCIECKKAKAAAWHVRLTEDIKKYTNGKFVTMTFSDESLSLIDKKIHPLFEGYDRDNAIATYAVRHFLERYRDSKRRYNKLNKNNPLPTALRHWFVTELGQNSTERIHLHGIIWTDEPKSVILKLWQYGNMGYELTWAGEKNYVTAKSCNYLSKYIHKQDPMHPNYQSVILTSAGLGKAYLETPAAKDNAFKGIHTRANYKLDNGYTIALPKYLKNKLYTDEQKEALWMMSLDRAEKWINGEKYTLITQADWDKYFAAIKYYQHENIRLGYGTNMRDEKQIKYEKELRKIKKEERENRLLNKRQNINETSLRRSIQQKNRNETKLKRQAIINEIIKIASTNKE